MNLWRIAMDEASGTTRGLPEPVTAGVQASAALPTFSRDGTRLAFRSRVASVNPVAIPFDPASLRAGEPSLLDSRNNIRLPSSVSPDGKQIAFFSIGENQEDLFIGTTDGSMRRVTDDAARDRAPIFTPDGRALVFYSNRDGKWEPWIIGTDGGGLRKIAEAKDEAVYVIVSPKGESVVFSSGTAQEMFLAPLTSTLSTPTKMPGVETGGKIFAATSWSPDGTRLTGPLGSTSGQPGGVGVYDLASRQATEVASDETYGVQWLADNRRVVYFTTDKLQLVVLDTVSRARTVVDVRLPGAATNEIFAISPDNRTIYYGAARAEADVWIVERK
jgi:Tol biopolymer transport system component